MKNKQVATVRTITGELIGGFLLYGIAFGLLFNIIHSAITNRIETDSQILIAIITIILEGITVFLVWRCSIATTFRNRLIEKNDVPKVMKNLLIFTVIIYSITALVNFSKVNDTINKTINSKFLLSERVLKYMNDSDEIAKYNEEKNKAINEAKSIAYKYLAVLEIGSLAVYLGILPLQKKAILRYTDTVYYERGN